MTWMGANRRRGRSAQIAVGVISQRRCAENSAKANRTAYSLSLVVYDKLVDSDAGELSLDLA